MCVTVNMFCQNVIFKSIAFRFVLTKTTSTTLFFLLAQFLKIHFYILFVLQRQPCGRWSAVPVQQISSIVWMGALARSTKPSESSCVSKYYYWYNIVRHELRNSVIVLVFFSHKTFEETNAKCCFYFQMRRRL